MIEGEMAESEDGLTKRFKDLEASQTKLREQLQLILSEGRRETEGTTMDSNNRRGRGGGGGGGELEMVLPAGYFVERPYQRVVQHLGHALHIHRPDTGEIIYWNQSAENLYGWKDYEALGQKAAELLTGEETHPFLERVVEILNSGQSWSGQLPLKKRSGEMFSAMVTKTPLYDNGEFIGIITVSSDVAVLNDMSSEKSNAYWNESHGQSRESKLNFKQMHWPPQPQIASSVTTLATKVLAKFNIRGNANHFQGSDEGVQTNSDEVSAKTAAESSQPISPDNGDDSKTQSMKLAEYCASEFPAAPKKIVPDKWNNACDKRIECSGKGSSFEEMRKGLRNGKENDNHEESEKKDDAQQELQKSKEDLSAQPTIQKKHTSQSSHSSASITSVETTKSSQTGSLTVGEKEKEPNSVERDCDIRWEDLLFGEEIGQGSFAVVYRGVWNGSDVAIKVFLGKDYEEGVLLDYRKEIAIMKRLRHPNVLLYMGAVSSTDRLAIVTELLPRGSLFRALHRNNQKLDLRHRLRMALDVAKGMNYLHRRNPPIIHRDLKSSNLLVDKNWTVKVGDFGLSCLKISTVLTAKSGRGTPQWMAPEVLRGECTNEKSDVFSYGVVLWELMTEAIPWSDLNSLQVVGVVGFMDRRLDLPEGMDPRVSSVICDCWESDPGRRPSFQELVKRMGDLTAAVTPSLAHRRSELQTRESLLDY